MLAKLFKDQIKPRLTEFLQAFLDTYVGCGGVATPQDDYYVGYEDGFNTAIDIIEAELTPVDSAAEKKIAILVQCAKCGAGLFVKEEDRFCGYCGASYFGR